ncbi:MAG TPA: efflux RND transporter periplasmic adaptor subunit [Vicinamibacterales bacterium]|nr:efflux RND transporter periplasmic adaptor subunit [Vicinamibacterales bacterium]
MSDTPSHNNPTAPPDAEAAAQPGKGPVAGQRSRVGTYVLVAVVSFGIGAAGGVFALRYFASAPAETATALATTAGDTVPGAAGDGMAGMNMGGGEHPRGENGAVYISQARQQLIGVRTAELVSRALDATIRTVGTLAHDETRVTEVHPKVSGWVERVFVDFVGKPVRRGQPLLTIYSPDLVATQNEYLLALKAKRQLGDSTFPETRAGADSLVAATRERLRLWDITDAQIASWRAPVRHGAR